MDHQISTLREEAEFFRLTIAMGLLGPSDAVAWADRTIMALDTPPIELINVSLASRQAPDEFLRLLTAIPGPADLTAAAHRVLGLLGERLENRGLALETAVDMLWIYCISATLPKDEASQAEWYCKLFDWVQEGETSSPHEFREELIVYLRQASAG